MNAEIDLKAFWSLSYGMYLVSSHLEDRLNCQLSNTVFQVTDTPLRLAVSINKSNLTHEYILQSGVFAVSVLDEATPMTFIGLFGFKSGRDTDKLSQVSFKKGVTGCPIVTDHTLSALEAKVIGQFDAGTHTIFFGEVVAAEVLREGTPLTYAFYHEKKKGKTPEKAPTHKPFAEAEKS